MVIASDVLAAVICAGLIFAEIEEHITGLDVRLADTVAATANRTGDFIKSADLALRVAQNAQNDWAGGRISDGELTGRLIEIKNSSPLLSFIGWADRNGNFEFASTRDGEDRINVSDAEFFRAHRESQFKELFISMPIADRAESRPLVAISRRQIDTGGEFNGAMVGYYDRDFIQKFFSSFAIGKEAKIGALRRDGTLIFANKDDLAPGLNLRKRASVADALDNIGQGRARNHRSRMGNYSISRWQKVDDTDLVIFSTIPIWPNISRVYYEFAAFLAICLAFVLISLVYLRSRVEGIDDSIEHATELTLQSRDISRLLDRTRTIMDGTIDGMVIIDGRGKILEINKSVQRIFGYSEAEVVGKNVEMLMPNPHRDAHDSYIRNYRETGEAKIIGIGREVSGMRKNGEIFPLDLGIGEMVLPDGDRHFVGSIRDITQRKEIQSQLVQSQKLEAVAHLTGGVAHDFNNLLYVIQGSIQMAMRGGIDPRIASRLNAALRAAARGSALVKSLLVFSRKSKLQSVHLDVKKALADLEPMVTAAVGDSITVTNVSDVDVGRIYVDRGQFESAFMNLVINSRDAMPDGGKLTVESRVIQVDDSEAESSGLSAGHYVSIALSDNGIGMDADTARRALEPFFTTKEIGKGSGLGLAMVYGFTADSGGKLSLRSSPGAGCCVTMFFPLADSGVGEGAKTDRDLLAGENLISIPRKQNALKVLVVDDELELRNFTLTFLADHGYEPIGLADGRQAIGLLRSGVSFDILLSDVSLPGGVSGMRIAEVARELLPNIAVIYISGLPPDQIPDAARAVEGQFLQKPVSPETLLSALEKTRSDAEIS